MSKDKRDDHQLTEDIRKFMSNEKHSLFYDFQEIAEGIAYKKEKHLILAPYNGLERVVGVMQCQHLITTGGAAAPTKYVLTDRYNKFLEEHKDQIL